MNDKLCNKYIIIKKIGSGSFGDVYLSIDSDNNYYAIKTEQKKHHKKSKLKEEYIIYNNLHNNGFIEGIPKIYDFMRTSFPKTGDYNILVMELLGENLENLFISAKKKFNLATILKIGFDAISLLEKLHEYGYIHRDIKPANFLIGKSNPNQLYIMDFGLSKKYEKHGKHIKLYTNNSLVGTARYASINVHMGMECSRRDDIESVGYMLLYFFLGVLPWQGYKKNRNKNDKKFTDIGDKKKMTDFLAKEYNNVPKCFFDIIRYARLLKFTEEPDYEYIKNLFLNTAKNNKIKLKYQWI